MTYLQKLAAIRAVMKENKVDAYIIPSSDPHTSEYLPDHYKCIAFASGFTGSAGTLVITHDFAGLWADFRYFTQAEEQLLKSGYDLVKLKVQHTPEYIPWLYEVLPEHAIVAFDDRLLSVQLGEFMYAELSLKAIQIRNYDFLSPIWNNRPVLPVHKASLLNENEAGKPVPIKLKELRAELKKLRCDYHLISSLDDIAWLFNIRGQDVPYNPVVLSFALITPYNNYLFIDLNKLSADDKKTLCTNEITLKDYDAVAETLRAIPANASLFIDPKKNCTGLVKELHSGIRISQGINPTTRLKAIKNTFEINAMRVAMIKDGVAMTRFGKWLEDHINTMPITELSLSQQLKIFRQEQKGFAGLSFTTIAGYNTHASLPHYTPSQDTDVTLKPKGLLLVDSGSQYYYGTTDITRMFPLGETSEEAKKDYTLVLKALIEGSSLLFPKGTCGYQIDSIIRKPLWDYSINYGHGTGHGIGFYLNVHEGPQNISPANVPVAMEKGMITSIEPGIYRPESHGVRIENLVLTTDVEESVFGEFLQFETLTVAHIDTSLVRCELLEKKHINWLNTYNQFVYDRLMPYLTVDESNWLAYKIQPVY